MAESTYFVIEHRPRGSMSSRIGSWVETYLITSEFAAEAAMRVFEEKPYWGTVDVWRRDSATGHLLVEGVFHKELKASARRKMNI